MNLVESTLKWVLESTLKNFGVWRLQVWCLQVWRLQGHFISYTVEKYDVWCTQSVCGFINDGVQGWWP